MKKIIISIVSFLLLILAILGNPKKAKAYGDLDRIEKYEIWIDPKKEDGSLDTRIKISWRVLDDYEDGPLEWVKIGIPNRFVKDIKPLSDNIRKIKYYSDSGSYIRVDFDRKYYANETVTFEFSFNEWRIYQIKGNSIYYNYASGYFNEILVDDAYVYWNKEGIDLLASYKPWTSENDDYYIYNYSLDYGKQISVEFSYDKSYFNSIDSKLTYSSQYMTFWDYFLIYAIIVGAIAIIVGIIIARKMTSDPYMDNRGFIGGYYYHPIFIHHYGYGRRYYGNGIDKKGNRYVNPQNVSSSSSSHSGSTGGHCACACACACAGGGRAGCSKKDFYSAKIRKSQIDNIDNR